MSVSIKIGADIAAVFILVFALYFPRHGRRDMVIALLGINVGVLSVSTVLSESTVSAGLGLGLFGVLSIIRLRSQELDQEEVVYYFSALALGILGGIEVDSSWIAPSLMAAILAVMFVGDHPRLFARTRSQTITLDAAYANEVELAGRLEELLDADIRRLKVKRLDLVTDTTVVAVRYDIRRPA